MSGNNNISGSNSSNSNNAKNNSNASRHINRDSDGNLNKIKIVMLLKESVNYYYKILQ